MAKIINADFLKSSETYADREIRTAAKNETLSLKEQKTLKEDLQDDVQFYRDHVLPKGSTVEVEEFLKWRKFMLEASVAY